MAWVGRLRVDEDVGAMTLCDVGRLTRSDFLTRWDGDLSMTCYEDVGALPLRDVGRLATVGLSDQMGWMTCRWLVTTIAGLCP